MMRKYLVIALLCLFAQPVQAATLSTELAHNRVDITTGFNGTDVVLFGTTDVPTPSIAVTLRGPEKKVVVRKKGRVAGAWMNTSSMEFRRVPSYYDYAMTISESQSVPVALMQANLIGVEHLDFYPENPSGDEQVNIYFRDALVSSLQRKGFYPIKVQGVQFLKPQFFKVTFKLPPGVPTGIYTIESYLIQDGVVTSKESRSLQVGQVGFNARVYIVATESSWLYGLVITVLAALSGWAAFTFLRRD